MNQERVKIVEVGLRDGLQNESSLLSIGHRFDLLQRLISAGVSHFELGAFVSPQWVPQMSGTEDLVRKYMDFFSPTEIERLDASVLVPNEIGMNKAVQLGVREVAIFISCTETFSKKNINCTIAESLERVRSVIEIARAHKIKVRGYLSVCFGCPFEGAVDESKVVELALKLQDLGCYEISIGDTIGIANPTQVKRIFKKLLEVIPATDLAGHFHDTRGLALANVLAAHSLGIKTFDSSLAGLGGCPYAPGASGNVATEDVVNMFHQMDIETGLNLEKLVRANLWLRPLINHDLQSKVSRALTDSLQKDSHE